MSDVGNLIRTEIFGITNSVLTAQEYSSSLVNAPFQNLIQAIATPFTTWSTNPPASSGVSPGQAIVPSMTDAANIYQAMYGVTTAPMSQQTSTAGLSTTPGLLQLAQQGVLDPNGVPNGTGPNAQNVAYITYNMAQSLNLLSESLGAVNFPQLYQQFLRDQASGANAAILAADQANVLNALANWAGLATEGLNTIMANALNAPQTNHSLQSMIELDYVKQGNDQVSTLLNNLQNQLQTTNSILTLLTQIQDLHNQVTATNLTSTSNITLFTSGNPNANTFNAFNKAGLTLSTDAKFSSVNAYTSIYKADVGTIFAPSGTTAIQIKQGSSATNQQFTQYQSSLATLISQLNKATVAAGGTANAPGSLAASLQTVLSDMQSAGSLSNWLVDNSNSTSSANTGNYQQDITNALTSAQNLNSTQTQSIQQQLFVFQEFYQSAGSALTSISSTIVQMAQGVAGA